MCERKSIVPVDLAPDKINQLQLYIRYRIHKAKKEILCDNIEHCSGRRCGLVKASTARSRIERGDSLGG